MKNHFKSFLTTPQLEVYLLKKIHVKSLIMVCATHNR